MTTRIAIAVLAAALVILPLIFGGGDVELAHALRNMDPAARRAAAWVSRAGDPTAYLILAAAAGAYFYFARHRDPAWRVAALCFTAIAASGLLVNLLKFLFGRTRPGALYDRGVAEFLGPTLDSAVRSFPSGHSATVGAVAVLAWILLPRWRWVALGFALAVAASRLLVGYHFVSDVIAGLLVGATAVVLTRHAFVRRGWLPVAGGAYAPPRYDR